LENVPIKSYKHNFNVECIEINDKLNETHWFFIFILFY